MKKSRLEKLMICFLLIGAFLNIVQAQDKPDSSTVNKIVENWPARPRLAVQEMMAKYGAPLEATSETMVWHNAGLYKRIMVTKMEVPHDFPKPHMDFLEHTVSYNVPTDKVSDLVAFDASMTINKTAGEMSARCDLEGHNILTLNLANDIIKGKKSVEQARKAFGEFVVADVEGKHPSYVYKLQFEPQKNAAFADKPIIPGSPVRASDNMKATGSDAEALAFVIAIDDNEVLAATAAENEKLSSKAMDYAKMIHLEHGKNLADTAMLGQKIKVTPIDTKAVDDLRVKGAQELSELIPLKDKDFENAYIKATVKNHTEALSMIDQLLKTVDNEELKKHLTATREHVAMHLDKAKTLR
ncbi:MAG: DUF4142 domain-containing protein [Bacteriovorax sp.]|nr:DUF4142 domain-containing protein [Bacteriovorax sp.]